MSDPQIGKTPHEERLCQLIAEYLEAEHSGRPQDRETLLAQHPDLAEELRNFLADHDRLNSLAQPLRSQVLNDDGTDTDERKTADSSKGGSATATRPPTADIHCFGDFELQEEIDRGGMGVVYKARQISLNRTVALKMILAGQFANKEEVRRFRAEAEAAANLDHPGIVPIFEVGEHEGQHYFSMGYVEGQSLAERLREGPLPSRDSAMLLKQICEAVQYAHEHGIIHRDLKPANVLLESRRPRVESPEPQGSGDSLPTEVSTLDARPRITDFGLAKQLRGGSDLTGTGQILGTPSYMSPEQASGSSGRVGTASDVYSLGAILYQALTGRPPFQAATPLDTVSQVLDSEPLPPRLLNRNVPRDLEAICMKCLEKDPVLRYASARDLRDELQRYLDGESIQASSVNVIDRLTRVLRQSRHEEQFRGWGLGLISFGIVILLFHLAIFAVERTEFNRLLAYWLPRTAMFVVLLILLWRFRPHSLLPTNFAERLVWVVWIGYLLAIGVVNIVLYVTGQDQRQLFAFASILAGLGFLVMGGQAWGGSYVIGLVFMAAAPILAMVPGVASLTFGALWAAALFAFGLHYWRRGRAALAVDATPTHSSAEQE